MKRLKHIYVVGYQGDKDVVYGNKRGFQSATLHWAEPMTKLQAKRYLKAMPCANAAIYKLVKVDPE